MLKVAAARLMRFAKHRAVKVGIFYVLQLVAGVIVIYIVSLAQTQSLLVGVINNTAHDISYRNGVWDTAHYDVDPDIRGNYRLYIFSKDGYVIDRWRPIPGYLDTSDIRYSLKYTTPQTVHTVTDQNWRLYTLPIKDDDNTTAVITVGRIIDNQSLMNETDDDLSNAANIIRSGIVVQNGDIATDKVSIGKIPLNTSFQVVDQYNKVRLKSNNAGSVDRIPNFIDPSYLADELKNAYIKQFQDNARGDRYLIMTHPIINNNQTVGTIVVARILTPTYQLIEQYALIMLGVGMVGLLVLPIYNQYRKRMRARRLRPEDIRAIVFDKQQCALMINGHKIVFTYATNQYYLCLALFKSPRKKCETGDLLEKMGIDDHTAWRKIYDSMVTVNKKCDSFMTVPLIVMNNKTYQINPILAQFITKK